MRRRILPSGRPEEEEITLVQPDPTWAIEYEDFKRRCAAGESNIANDLLINRNLREIAQQARSRG